MYVHLTQWKGQEDNINFLPIEVGYAYCFSHRMETIGTLECMGSFLPHATS